MREREREREKERGSVMAELRILIFVFSIKIGFVIIKKTVKKKKISLMSVCTAVSTNRAQNFTFVVLRFPFHFLSFLAINMTRVSKMTSNVQNF